MIIWEKLAAVLAMTAFASCAFSQQLPPPPEPSVIDPNARSVDSGMVLDELQVKILTADAEAGDGFAAFRLSLHFRSLQKNAQADYWLLYSAARGHGAAQYNIWFNLKDRGDCKSKIDAFAWISSAALSGDELAKKELGSSKEAAQSCLLK